LNRRPVRLQCGLTLVELMVSIAIGLLVVSAMTYVYMGSRGAYRGSESLARIQDAGRFALDSIARDIRRSGALGCGTVVSATTGAPITVNVLPPIPLIVNNGTSGPAAATAIQGFGPNAYTPLPTALPPTLTLPAGPGGTPAPAYWGGDVLQIQITSGPPVRVTTPPSATGTFTIADNTVPNSGAANFNTGDIALLASCSGATVFKVQANPAAPAATAPATIGYAPVGGPVPALTAGAFAVGFFPTLQHFDQVIYYLGVNADGTPALYRYSTSSGIYEELVDNIEDMDVVYGVGVAGAMATGTFKHAGPNGTMVNADWANVLNVRISVIARGEQNGAAPAAQTLAFRATDPSPVLGAWVAPDTQLRQVFTLTAAMRSRLKTP